MQNYQTLSVRKDLDIPEEFVLVDDVVTAGATLLGAANKLSEAYPGVNIRGFAAARTITDATRFRRTVDPVHGTITLRPNGRTQREP
jgi:orotate phosphoribosyltransferase